MPIDHRLDTNVLTRSIMARPGPAPSVSRDPRQRRRASSPAAPAPTAAAGSNRKPTGWPPPSRPSSPPIRSTPFTFAEFDGNVRGLRGLLRTRPPYVACAARAILDPAAPQSCPVPAPVDIPAPMLSRG